MKVTKKALNSYLGTLNKLTDSRFKFLVNRTFEMSTLCVNMYFEDELITSLDFHQTELNSLNAYDHLIAMILDSTKVNRKDYFNNFGISFELYYNNFSAKKPFYSFRLNCGYKWVKIGKELSKYIIKNTENHFFSGSYDNMISFCAYDIYYKFNIKACL